MGTVRKKVDARSKHSNEKKILLIN